MKRKETLVPRPETLGGLFPGWWQVVAGFGHAFLGYGLWLYGWNSFAAAMIREFGWTTAQVAGASTVGTLTAMAAAPLAGGLADRWGARRVSALGVGAAGAGFLLLGTAPGHSGLALVWLYLGYGILVMLGINGGLYPASFTAVNRWFVRRRVLAMGLVSLAATTSAILFAPLSQAAVAAWGWRGAAFLWGVATLAAGLPLAGLFSPHFPERHGWRPDGGALLPAEPIPVRDFSLGQALGTSSFWVTALASLLHGYATAAFPLFQNLRMQELGYAPQEAATFLSLQFLVALLGRATVTVLGDGSDVRWSAALAHASMAVGAALFALAPGADRAWMSAWVILWGYGYGAWAPLNGALRGAYFGRASFGRIWGTHNAVAALGGLLAPAIADWRRAATGSYGDPYLLGAGATALAALLYAAATRPKGQYSHRQLRQSWVALETRSTD